MRRTKAEINHEKFVTLLSGRLPRPLTVDSLTKIAGLHAVTLSTWDGVTIAVVFSKSNITFVRDDTRSENGYANYKNVSDAFTYAITALAKC